MKAKTIAGQAQKSYVLVFDTDDEVVSNLVRFASECNIHSASITGIGGFRDVKLGYFDLEKRAYKPIPVREQVEVLSLTGNLSQDGDGNAKLHAHVVVGKSDGNAMGGHLMEAHVRPTLELVLVETPAHLRRQFDPERGLALLQI